jgi:tRNA uridine 5-carbamoylmethylation protein Kti12
MESTGSLSIAASMGLANLQNEPQRLQSEADKLNTNFDNLVMENYKIFVENLSCSVNLRTEDKKITEVSTELKESLHGLNQQCSAFRDRVHHFVDYHKRNRKTLQHHMQLVELLEVTLML